MTTRWETPTAKSIDDKTEEKPYHVEVHLQMIKDIRNVLFVYRFLNAISIATFFQPDEYYQALEPAWQLAFGEGSGAWMTWVRSSKLSRITKLTSPGMATSITFLFTSSIVCGHILHSWQDHERCFPVSSISRHHLYYAAKSCPKRVRCCWRLLHMEAR